MIDVPVRSLHGAIRTGRAAPPIVLLACMLAACGTGRIDAPPASDAPVDAAVVDAPAEDVPPATVGCDPAPVQSMLGEVAGPGLEARARDAAGARTVRTLAPGQAVTREYAEGRLNLQLGADRRLARAYCG